MTVFDRLQSKRIDELVEWFDENTVFDGSPWLEWFDTKYCDDCEPVIGLLPYFKEEQECSWCELHGKCKYYQEMDDIPDNKQIIELWLESED